MGGAAGSRGMDVLAPAQALPPLYAPVPFSGAAPLV